MVSDGFTSASTRTSTLMHQWIKNLPWFFRERIEPIDPDKPTPTPDKPVDPNDPDTPKWPDPVKRHC